MNLVITACSAKCQARLNPVTFVQSAEYRVRPKLLRLHMHSAGSWRKLGLIPFTHNDRSDIESRLIILCTGVAWGCRWTWDYTGIFRETCYCEDKDGCNSAGQLSFSVLSAVLALLAILYNTVHLL